MPSPVEALVFSAGLLRSPDLDLASLADLLLARLLFHGFAACLTLLFFFQQGFLMRTQGGGTTGFFIALGLFFHADDRLRYGRSGRFGCLFRFFAFAAFVLFGFGRFFSFNRFFRRLVVCF